jgi:hypothetical protein
VREKGRRKRYLAARVFLEGEIKAHYFREEVKHREKMEKARPNFESFPRGKNKSTLLQRRSERV